MVWISRVDITCVIPPAQECKPAKNFNQYRPRRFFSCCKICFRFGTSRLYVATWTTHPSISVCTVRQRPLTVNVCMSCPFSARCKHDHGPGGILRLCLVLLLGLVVYVWDVEIYKSSLITTFFFGNRAICSSFYLL